MKTLPYQKTSAYRLAFLTLGPFLFAAATYIVTMREPNDALKGAAGIVLYFLLVELLSLPKPEGDQ